MSFCEHMVGSDSSLSANKKDPEEKLNIQNELIWGLTYRNYKENEKNKPIRPIQSPIDIPFEICRAELMLKKKKPAKGDTQEEDRQGKGEYKPDSEKTKSIKRKIRAEKPSLLERSVWSQSKYMDYLSIPGQKYEEPKLKKYKKRCELEPCPPRFVQLAVPNKRKVFANWKEYAHFLPTEMLMRYEEILHTDQNLEPREARYYYKKLDRQRQKELKKKRRREKKKKQDKEKVTDWKGVQVELLAKDIVDYIKDEPLFTLNYKQMLLSDGILGRLEATHIMKKPSRKTKKQFKKTVIEGADKFAIWIDTLTRFVDVQAIESDEDIPPLSLASLSEEGEGEGSSEYESSTDDELRDEQLFGEEDAIWGEEGGEGDMGRGVEDVIKGIFDIGEDGMNIQDMLNDLDEDILSKLIQILSNCSDDFLNSEINEEKMPGVRYIDVLNRLKALKKALVKPGGTPFLEQIMIDWALRNDPDKVDDAVLKKIHEVAALLEDWLFSGGKGIGIGIGGGLGIGEGEGEGEDGLGIGGGVGEGAGFDNEDFGGQGVGGVRGVGGAGGIGGIGGYGEDEGDGTERGEDAGEGTEYGKGADRGIGTEGAEGEDAGVPKSSDISGGLITDGEGGTTADMSSLIIAGEDGMGLGSEYDVSGPGEGPMGGEGEDSFIYDEERKMAEREKSRLEAAERERLDGRIIKGHKPSKVFEHSPDTVCCLSLKTWAVWLLEITHNAHNWTQWMSCVIQKVREYASIVRGDVKLPNGQTKVLRKQEWRDFIKETEENVIAWRQYSAHVKDLSQSIVENFHGKEVNCCPKCLQDHLIRNVVVAHDTLQALTEAISCAAYWQRCLDTLVEKTCGLTDADKEPETEESSSEESDGDIDIEEVKEEESGESVYEIEGIESNVNNQNPENK